MTTSDTPEPGTPQDGSQDGQSQTQTPAPTPPPVPQPAPIQRDPGDEDTPRTETQPSLR